MVQHENGVPEEDTVEYYLNDDERVDVILDRQKSKLWYRSKGCPRDDKFDLQKDINMISNEITKCEQLNH